ncbi:MAG: hypothetical protein M3492_09890 [Actinomycetota bacterium]|nr:hypothetical protein [Actinomycetota bacterium]
MSPKQPCASCRLPIECREPIVFALQESGSGPYHGMSGWYIAEAHARCGQEFIRDYQRRLCRGCGRTMWVRGGRRTHCSSRCRHVDFKRRENLAAEALAEGRVLYRDDLYWLSRQQETQRVRGSE